MSVKLLVTPVVRCDVPGCLRQLFLNADLTTDMAVRRAVVAFGWRGDEEHIECPSHHRVKS